MKKPRTLKQIDRATLGDYDMDDVYGEACDWIMYLEEQRDLHLDWCAKGVGENPNFDYPKGFDGNLYYSPDDREAIIHWIKYFFGVRKRDVVVEE